MRWLIDSLLELVYPELCPACDEPTPRALGLCTACAESLYELGAACDLCADPQEAPLRCRRCRRVRPPFSSVTAPWRYGGELAAALRRLKYGGRRGAGRAELLRPLAALLAPALADAAHGVDVIIPVPLHPSRLRQRGFGQAQGLAAWARRFARMRVPLDVGALVRVRATAEQAGLGRVARRLNVSGAFAVPARAARRLVGRRVLLVDDVVTSTATAAACARALLRAGAADVAVLALARAEA